MEVTFCSEWFEIGISKQLLTLARHHAQQAQAAQVLKSEQPDLGKNSRQVTMLWADEIDVLQIGNTDQRRLRGRSSQCGEECCRFLRSHSLIFIDVIVIFVRQKLMINFDDHE